MKRFENGYWSSKPPFGYVTERQPEGGSILVPKSGESELVSEMFEKYASGKYSLREIQRWLNATIVLKQKSRRGINQILQSRVYLGEVPYGRYVESEFHPRPDTAEWRPGKHQALVTPDVFDRVQEMLQGNKRSFGKGSKGIPGPSRGGPNPRYLFTGLIYCGACGSRYIGSPVHSRKGGNKPRYLCGRKHTGMGCDSHSIYEPRIREQVIPPIEKLLAQLNQEGVRASFRAELARQEEDAKSADVVTKLGAKETLERLEARLSSLEDAYLDGDIAKDRYRSRRDELTRQIKELQSQLAERPHLALPDTDQLFAMADTITVSDMDAQSWREIVENMVSRITVEGHNIRVEWKPEYAPMMAL